MGEHLTQRQVEEYGRQRLGVAELLSVSDHLGECEACRRRVEIATNGDAAFFALRSEVFGRAEGMASPPTHLTEELMAGYVDRNLSGEALQAVADHLTCCEQCALSVNDLQAFKEQVAPTLDRELHPTPARAATESWWQRAVTSLSLPLRKSPGLAFGAALAVLLLAVTAWVIWRTPRQSAPEQQTAVSPAPPSPPAPPPQPASVPVVARLNDGKGQLILDQDGKLSGAEALPAAYQSMLKEALATRRVESSSQLKGLTRPPSSLMSTGKQQSDFSVIEPAGSVLMTDRPTFRWSAMEGAAGYVVEVYDSAFNLMTASPELTAPAWTPPQPLPRGKVYGWQVKAIKDGQEFKSPRPPAPPARFRVLDQARANELMNARRAYPSAHLALALLYAEAGLLREAEQELRVLQKANPDSEIARGLLDQVKALRRRSG